MALENFVFPAVAFSFCFDYFLLLQKMGLLTFLRVALALLAHVGLRPPSTPVGDAKFLVLRLIFAARYHAARKPRGGACQPSPADDNGGGSFPGAARLPPKNGIAHFSAGCLALLAALECSGSLRAVALASTPVGDAIFLLYG